MKPMTAEPERKLLAFFRIQVRVELLNLYGDFFSRSLKAISLT